jgi:tetratricopeptide (TPR) repeat protein
MIREDYILTWIKRYIRWLAEIAGFVKAKDYEAAIRRIDQVLRTLLEVGPDSVTDLSDGEILARLTLGELGQLVEEKCMVLAAVLKQLGMVSAALQRLDLSRDCFLKSLHLVLGLKLRGDGTELAEYVPAVEELVEALKPYELPPRTHAALTIFYEQGGTYSKAEDALFALLESAPGHADALGMGVAFYERLLALGDATLDAGGLPRAEVEAGLEEIRKAKVG